MKNILTILLIAFTIGLSAQNYVEHKVKSGETIESIAKKYLVTPFDIYALNPDAKTKFQPNTVLIIPSSKIKNEPIVANSRELTGYKTHKVKRKETLYSLTKKYSVSEEEIKKANRRLQTVDANFYRQAQAVLNMSKVKRVAKVHKKAHDPNHKNLIK